LILFGGNAAKVAGTNLDGAFADGVARFTKSVAGQQRLIYRDITSVRVLDEERDVRRQIEQSLQRAQINRPQFMRQGGLERFCARFHGWG